MVENTCVTNILYRDVTSKSFIFYYYQEKKKTFDLKFHVTLLKNISYELYTVKKLKLTCLVQKKTSHLTGIYNILYPLSWWSLLTYMKRVCHRKIVNSVRL